MTALAPFIETRDLTKRFGENERAVTALVGLSMKVEAHEFLSVLGPSGCGKSTLLFIVAGLIQATTGRVLIKEEHLQGPFTNAGIVFQRDNLLEWRRIIDNVMLPVEIKRLDHRRHLEHAHHLLQKVGLEGFEKSYPHELSGGMRQRAALCRALVCDVPLLLMDEPFGALDALSREEHQLLLQDVWLNDRKTVVFVTHDIREAVLLSDRILLMTPRPGRVADLIDIDLPRPRGPEITTQPKFNEYVSDIRNKLFRREDSRGAEA